MRKFVKTSIAMAIIATATSVHAEGVEVLHWWTSGGEAAALNVLKDDLKAKVMPVAGGEQAMTVLLARVTAGNPPTAFQGLGFDIIDWAKQGSLANLNDVAARYNWDIVVPEALQQFARIDGKWVSASVNVHSINWVWANKAVLDANNIKVPSAWEELTAAMDKLKAAGITPIARGGQPWQNATVFDGVSMSVLGPAKYKAAFVDLDESVLGGTEMKEAFDRMAVIRSIVDDNFSGRGWNLATAMVINGDAGFKMMSDWAKGEFLNA
ncbi:MAG: ABC transporter substrate-binding protein [Granulosicoccus sp.]